MNSLPEWGIRLNRDREGIQGRAWTYRLPITGDDLGDVMMSEADSAAPAVGLAIAGYCQADCSWWPSLPARETFFLQQRLSVACEAITIVVREGHFGRYQRVRIPPNPADTVTFLDWALFHVWAELGECWLRETARNAFALIADTGAQYLTFQGTGVAP